MTQQSSIHSHYDGDPDERQVENQKGPIAQGARSGRTPSPVAGSGRRQRLSGSRKSPGRSSHARNFRRSSGSHQRVTCEGESESSPKMRRNLSNLSRKGSALELRRGITRVEGGQQESGISMRRNHSFGMQMNQLSNSGSSHRRGHKSPVSQRSSLLITLNGSGASKTRDRSARRKNKQSSLRASTAGNRGTAQLNVFQTLERGLNCDKPSLMASNISDTSNDPASPEEPKIPAKVPFGLDSTAIGKETPEKRNTLQSLNKKSTKESPETTKRSSAPVQLQLEGGVQRADAYGRRFSWWNLPSSSGLGEGLILDEDDDLPPAVVPPSRRRSLLEGSVILSPTKNIQTPKQSKKERKSSSSNKKKSRRMKSSDSMDSSFTLTTADVESGSFRADSSEEFLSPTIHKLSIAAANGEDLLSPLPTKQLSSGTCTTESSTPSSRSSVKERRGKKSKHKSAKEGSTRSSSRRSSAKQKEDALDSSNRSVKISSLDDHFNRSSASFQASKTCDFSVHSKNSTKKSSRTSMSIKHQISSMDASRSSMSVSLHSDDLDALSIESDFEGSVDFDFDYEDFQREDPSPSGEFFGEESFSIVDDESKRVLRNRMKTRTRKSSGGTNTSSQSIRRGMRSPVRS